MEDSQIVALYWERDPLAIDHSKEKYGGYCYCVAKNILGSREDAEECVNDTWLNAWNGMPPHRPQMLRMFLAKITRCLAFNRYKADHTQKRGSGQLVLVLEELAECIAQESDVQDDINAQELGAAIRRFVHELPAQERNLFIRRYFFTESVAQLAAGYGISANHASVTLSRTRKKLRSYLIKEGFLDESTRSI